MSKINNFSHSCQYKSNNTSIIILPNVFYTHQSLTDYNLATKHVVVLCHLLLSCWRNQASWLGEQNPKLDSMLSRPMRAKIVELDYHSMGKTLCLAKDGLKSTLIELEQAKLLKRVLIKNKWYVLLHDQAFKLYLNNNRNRKRRINKGNIISTSWLSTLKTDSGQTDFTGALILGEITYFSRVFKRKQPIDDHFEFEQAESVSLSASSISDNYLTNNEDAECFDIEAKQDDASTTRLVSKSKGLVAYFEHDHFKKKFPYLSSKVIDRTLSRLEKNNIISVERKKFTRGRKVIKRLYITLNYQLIQKGVDNKVVDFIFKTDEYLSSEQLADFCQNTPPFLYNIYNNKTIIYPKRDFFSNFTSFSSLSSSNCFTYADQVQAFKQLSSKKWNQVSSNNTDNNKLSKYEKYTGYDKTGQISFLESFRIKKRAFKVPRYLYDMHSSLKRLYRAYFANFNYPLSFCCLLLDSLAKKYPGASFRGENQFISYFRKILAQEKRASWQVKSRKYFEKALSLADLVYDKLPSIIKEKLNQIAMQVGKKIEELPALLCKLAQRNAKHLFSCVSSFLSYMKQVLLKLKSKEELQEAYKALPRVGIGEIASYLNRVEASYHRVGPEEHLRRKIASTLPMTVAYHLLHSCNFYCARVDDERNFIIPSKNKNWAEMIRGGIKNIIKNQVAAVYGQIKTIKFVQLLKREDITKEKLVDSTKTTTEKSTTKAQRIRIASGLVNTKQIVASCSNANSSYYFDARNEQNRNNTSKNETKFVSYELFHKRRLELEKKEKEKLKEKMLAEEQELKANNINLVMYENYKQAMKDAEIDKEEYIKKGGKREIAKELYKYPSFSEWLQLQQLITMS